MPENEKRTARLGSPFSIGQSHSAGDLTRTEASGAHINVLGRAVDDRLDALHIGLPGAVGAAVRVGHLNTEHDTLVAKFTFGHSLIPPRSSGYAYKSIERYDSRTFEKMQVLFSK